MQVGDKIPEILGRDQDGREIKASDYAGKKLVLYTYPKDNTSGCTAEACSLRDHRDQLRELGFEVLGVSKDSEASHKKFIEKQELNFPLIADTDTALLQALGAWGEKNMYGKKTMGTLRTTYLVDENGVITHIFTPKQIKTKEHAQQILDILK
ncbi:MAG: thioredoxin-dependent thiol peroxidase [Bacteroidales bacterium]|nr:thioredoxin-dependent thiol peroxidase [Bacteroidales bacterium]